MIRVLRLFSGVVWRGCSLIILSVAAACAPGASGTAPLTPALDTVVLVDTVRVTRGTDPDPELEQRIALLQLQLLERDAQISELQEQLDGAIQEVVRAMARLQTLASRAEAASAMAEAEIALEALSNLTGGEDAPEGDQAAHFLEISTGEFNDQNYGGSLYLASQARSIALAGQSRLATGGGQERRPGEVAFALPLPLQTSRRSNVRAGPGLGFRILFTLDPLAPLTGLSYMEEWVRMSDEAGRTGWIFYNLVGSRQPGPSQP